MFYKIVLNCESQDSFGRSKEALYKETLQATGFYVGWVVIVTAEFAPMPQHVPGYPGGCFPTAMSMRFLRHDGIYQSDVEFSKGPNPRTRREDHALAHRLDRRERFIIER